MALGWADQYSLRFEALEARRHLSVTVEDDVARIIGTDGADEITLVIRADVESLFFSLKVNGVEQPASIPYVGSGYVRHFVIDAGAGDDRVEATVHQHNLFRLSVYGRDGKDWINLNAVARVVGGDGNDRLCVDGGAVFGGKGNDRLYAEGAAEMHGGGGDDTIRGSNGDDRLRGGSGDDALAGGFGKDTLWGGGGNDSLSGGRFNKGMAPPKGDTDDSLVGGHGNDRINGDNGSDTIRGGAGADHINGDSLPAPDPKAGFDDSIDAGDGDDEVTGGYGADTIRGGQGKDHIDGYGGGGVATDYPSFDRADSIYGGLGNDVIGDGGNGADLLDGGEGRDRSFGWDLSFEPDVSDVLRSIEKPKRSG